MRKENYLMLSFGLVLLLIGYVMMSCEGIDFQNFRGEIHSPVRIRFAPFCCMSGYLVVGLSLFADRLKRRTSKVS